MTIEITVKANLACHKSFECVHDLATECLLGEIIVAVHAGPLSKISLTLVPIDHSLWAAELTPLLTDGAVKA